VKRLTFDLEFITPAFIGGANQQAELRPASFVGLLRWWWRALKGECNIEKAKGRRGENFWWYCQKSKKGRNKNGFAGVFEGGGGYQKG
jgi:CRISPR/Cas system CMR-associated protein Cmr1 (group 7 of RAMP superfamily)